MSLKISTGIKKRPYFMVIYGPDGCGKTTFASDAPNCLVVGPETGSSHLNVSRADDIKSWGDILSAIKFLKEEKHDFKTVALDSLDWIEQLLIKDICEEDKVDTIGDAKGGYGVGLFDYDCLDSFPELIEVIERLVPGLSDIRRIGEAPKWGSFYKVTDSYLKRPQIYLKNGNLIEIKCDGGYAVLDSIHPDTGQPYIWLDGNHLINTDKNKLPVLPENLWDELIATAKKYGYWSPTRTKRIEGEPVPKKKASMGRGRPRTEHGAHDTLRTEALRLIGQGVPATIGAELIYQLDQDKHQPLPYFCDKTRGTDGRDPNPRVNAERFYASHSKTIKGIRSSENVPSVEGEKTEVPFFFVSTKQGLKPLYKEFAEYIKDKFNAVTDDSATFLYKETHFEGLSPQEMEALVYQLTQGMGQPQHTRGFISFTKANSYRKDFFDQANEGYLNLINGYLNVKTKEITPHLPEHRQQITLSTAYDPSAKCPLWEKFLLQIFENNNDLVEMVRDMIGYVLLGGEPFLQRAFVLHGRGRNGKSTLINIIESLIGLNNFSSVPMKDLDKPFSVVMLKNKVVNLREETPKETINAEAFKAAVGGANLVASRKFQDEFLFRCQARFIFACNDMPKFQDSSVGMLERLVFIPFMYEIPASERDTEIGARLRNELPGILNWALQGAERLMIFKHLTFLDATKEIKEEYKRDSDSVYDYFKEHLIVTTDHDNAISIKVTYSKYVEWSRETGRFPVQQRTFTKQLRVFGHDKLTDLSSEFLKRRDIFKETTRSFGYKNYEPAIPYLKEKP